MLQNKLSLNGPNLIISQEISVRLELAQPWRSLVKWKLEDQYSGSGRNTSTPTQNKGEQDL